MRVRWREPPGDATAAATAGRAETILRVPRLCAFYGIVITMYWRDHPLPHFHASYSGDSAQVDIETLQVLDGRLPPRALRLIQEWGELHRQELRDNWARAVAQAARPDRPAALA
jgi:hypothetical protein